VSAYRIISAERASFPVSVMCEVLGVSRPGFHQWERRAPSDRALSDAWLTSRIIEIHERARGVYGSRRVQAEPELGQGIRVSRRRVQRLMRTAGISGLVKVKKGRTTIRVPGVRVADDLVERRFKPSGPNVLWVADISSHQARSSRRERRGASGPASLALSPRSINVGPGDCVYPAGLNCYGQLQTRPAGFEPATSASGGQRSIH
jgi:hypothetical protein